MRDCICTRDDIWNGFIDELWSHLLDPIDCMDFINYYEVGWRPTIFHWPLSLPREIYIQYLNRMNDDRLWLSEWINPLIAGSNYAPMTVPLFEYSIPSRIYNYRIQPITATYPTRRIVHLSCDRVSHVFHIFNLYIATGKQILPRSLDQIIEYGGGTGDNIPMLREMGFEGTHIVYDFMPMLIMQQFFLRISNWPAYYADNLTYSSPLGRRKTLLVSCDLKASRMMQLLSPSPTAPQHTLFLASWSLSESSVEVRSAAMEQILQYQVKYILIAFQSRHSLEIDNMQWAKDLAHQLYYDHHYEICSWKMIGHEESYYFIAVRNNRNKLSNDNSDQQEQQEIETVVCSSVVGCTQDTLLLGSAGCIIE